MPGTSPRAGGALRTAAVFVALHLIVVGAHASPERDRGFADLSWGLRGGVNFAQHVGTEERESEYEVESGWREGVTAAVFVHWPVTDRFGLQQEIVYTQKGSSQRIGVEILEIPTTLDVTYEMDYIEIPTLTRFIWYRSEGLDIYTLGGMAMSIKISDHYELTGEVTDGVDTVPITASDDMSEVDMFDFSVVYGLGAEFLVAERTLLVEYRFSMSWNTLGMPTYAYVPFGDEEEILIENPYVPLKNQTHSLTMGIRF